MTWGVLFSFNFTNWTLIVCGKTLLLHKGTIFVSSDFKESVGTFECVGVGVCVCDEDEGQITTSITTVPNLELNLLIVNLHCSDLEVDTYRQTDRQTTHT